jgi:hypothetical protein
MALLMKLAILGSLVLVGLSVYPGVLVDLLFFSILLSPLWLPTLVIGGLIFLVVQARSARKKPVSPGLDLIADDIGVGKRPVTYRRWIILLPALLGLSLVLILNGIPRRVAFVLSRPAFQRCLATAPVDAFEGEPLECWLGIYFVDRYAADPRGGVYFRTHSGPDGIGPDTMSYGFAYRPHPDGSPFGNAGYGLSHLVGDWYGFSASNDW